MLSSQALTIFYSVCGVIVALSLFRMWHKSRAKYRLPIIPPANKGRKSGQEVSAASSSKSVMNPAMATVASQQTIPEAVAAGNANRPVYYMSPETPESNRWDDRSLLESSGMYSRNTNTMPRVLPEDIPGVDDSDRMFGSLLNPAFASLVPESDERREDTRRDLMAAGFYSPHALENLAATRYAMMMMAIVLFGSLLLLVPPQLEPFVVACCVLGPMLGWALPALYVRSKAKERKHEIERAMPDLLDMMNMCVGQGLTVPDSLQRVGRDFRAVYPALSQELSIVNEQSKISSMQTALENFSKRIDLPEVHSLTSLLIQTERMGTSISQALTTYSDTMRENQRQQADEKGNQATFRLLFPTVLCLMPAVYLFLLGPAINELQRFFYGGGIEQLNSGSQVVQRINATRSRGQNPSPNTQTFGR
jgi:tight adherence protein C